MSAITYVGPYKLDRRPTLRADKALPAPMPANLETPFRTPHHPGLGREVQGMASGRATADFPRLATPHRIMTMVRANKRMRDFMEYRIADMVRGGMAHIMP